MLFLLALLVWGALGLSFVRHLSSGAELVRLRNALLLEDAPASHQWSPESVPPDFKVESGPVHPLFARVVADHALHTTGDDWAAALGVGRHLLPDDMRPNNPIKASLAESYVRIREHGEGYCGDVVEVFTALLNAAGVFSRPWAFSFDGYGGHGHILSEVWDRQRKRWGLIDIYNNQYFLGADGQPLSAMEFRHHLLSGEAFHGERVHRDAPPGYVYPEKALDYYRRGAAQWYMWWGNAVMALDCHPVVTMARRFGRPVEQLAAILWQQYPRLRLLPDADPDTRDALAALRARLKIFGWLGVAVLLIGIVSLVSSHWERVT
ncbi:hypothetical protein [Nitrogeniibacter aestuarii]|uniref:hypothetical protein n=1 Tax=Nitrogeniibacter aestuarii TaxID=2815343 RepID=UPI001D105D0E|nr:hypothetical protein [Nitrogeniibacter aestuarii]